MSLKLNIYFTEKIELKEFKQKLKNSLLRKIWAGVMTLSQRIIINLLIYRLITVMKNFKKENVYDILLVLNYNMAPIKRNKGSAIFIHVAKKTTKKQRDV